MAALMNEGGGANNMSNMNGHGNSSVATGQQSYRRTSSTVSGSSSDALSTARSYKDSQVS